MCTGNREMLYGSFLPTAIQANAFIQSAMFQEYKYNDDTPCVFCINLNALIVSNIQK